MVAAAVLLTIALGTGMNIALFRVVWSALLKPLPYPNAARLVQVWRVTRTAGGFTPRDRRLPDGLAIELWRTRSHSFDGLASYRPWRATVGSGGDPDRTPAGLVSAEFFPVLGVRAQFGRTFTAAEVRPGADDVVVLSYGYWQTRFGGDRSLVGRSILIDGRLCQVIGVLPADFRDLITYGGSNQPSVYLPISKVFEGPLKLSSGFVIGRLKSEIGVAAARAELAALAQGRAQQNQPLEEQGVNITHLQDEIGFAVRPALLTMFAATGCILLIACTNVANLLLAQAVGRRQELAIRSALGAGRARLVRQLLTEALVLALAGALLGLGAAWALSRSMIALYPGTLPRVAEGGTSGAVLVFALTLAILTAAFFGILPALLATRGRHDAGLRVGRAWMGRGARRWRDGLIGIQVAVTVTVLIAAGLLLRSFAALRSVDLGFEHARLFTAQVVLPEARYRTAEDQARFAQAWIERLKTIPGVEQAAVTNSLPLAFNVLTSVQFDVAGQPEEHRAGGRAVAGDYFDAMGLRMKEGRPLAAADDGRRDVVVVNESFVRRFLKSAAVTGTAIRFGPRAATIVGVVHDLHNLSLERPAEPEIYMPFAALPGAYLDVVVRAARPSGGNRGRRPLPVAGARFRPGVVPGFHHGSHPGRQRRQAALSGCAAGAIRRRRGNAGSHRRLWRHGPGGPLANRGIRRPHGVGSQGAGRVLAGRKAGTARPAAGSRRWPGRRLGVRPSVERLPLRRHIPRPHCAGGGRLIHRRRGPHRLRPSGAGGIPHRRGPRASR